MECQCGTEKKLNNKAEIAGQRAQLKNDKLIINMKSYISKLLFQKVANKTTTAAQNLYLLCRPTFI